MVRERLEAGKNPLDSPFLLCKHCLIQLRKPLRLTTRKNCLENNIILHGKSCKELTQGTSIYHWAHNAGSDRRKWVWWDLGGPIQIQQLFINSALGSFASESWAKSARSFRIPNSERNQVISIVYYFFSNLKLYSSIHIFIGHLCFFFWNICSNLIQFFIGLFAFPLSICRSFYLFCYFLKNKCKPRHLCSLNIHSPALLIIFSVS